MPDQPTITVSIALSLGRVSDLLTSAIEGGSYGIGYWARVIGYEAPVEPPEAWKVRAFERSIGQPQSPEHPVYPHCEYPVNGGAMFIVEDSDGETREIEEQWDAWRAEREGSNESLMNYHEWLAEAHPDVKVHRLDMAAIQRGCAVMAEKFPRHWANFIAERDDAETGDVFVQCCLLGDIVYG